MPASLPTGRWPGKDLRLAHGQSRGRFAGRAATPQGERFPLLVKILDAQDKLSLQVHPPAAKAADWAANRRPKCGTSPRRRPAAELYAGLKRGVTRAEFERKTPGRHRGRVFSSVERARGRRPVPAQRPRPCPRRGLVIFEIQQNSDTTYRVFDWNRARPGRQTPRTACPPIAGQH